MDRISPGETIGDQLALRSAEPLGFMWNGSRPNVFFPLFICSYRMGGQEMWRYSYGIQTPRLQQERLAAPNTRPVPSRYLQLAAANCSPPKVHAPLRWRPQDVRPPLLAPAPPRYLYLYISVSAPRGRVTWKVSGRFAVAGTHHSEGQNAAEDKHAPRLIK